MRALSRQEETALAVLLGPSATTDANTPEGAALEASMRALVARGCATMTLEREADGSTTACFEPTEMGRLAWRCARTYSLGHE